jgi:hypothetical protein
MDLAAARQHIQSSIARMDALYLRPVFDEWAVLSRSNPKGILAYAGPRAENFRKQLAADTGPLRSVIGGRTLEIGDFEFATEAGGTQYDACLKIGATAYLVCNHTERAMAEIRQDPNWLKAQSAFFDLCEKFRADPLEE